MANRKFDVLVDKVKDGIVRHDFYGRCLSALEASQKCINYLAGLGIQGDEMIPTKCGVTVVVWNTEVNRMEYVFEFEPGMTPNFIEKVLAA